MLVYFFFFFSYFGFFSYYFFFFNDTATTEIYTLSLHDALPIYILNELSKQVNIHIITADTFGMAASQLKEIPCKLEILEQTGQISGKKKYIDGLGNRHVAGIGNGRNDSLMLKHSALGIAVIQREGASAETLINADIICRNIYDALDLFKNPGRLKATLRS